MDGGAAASALSGAQQQGFGGKCAGPRPWRRAGLHLCARRLEVANAGRHRQAEPPLSNTPAAVPPRSLLIDAGWRLALAGAAAIAAGLMVMELAGLGWRMPASVLMGYGVVAALILAGLAGHAPHRRFGPANQVTLARAVGVTLFIGVLGDGAALAPAGRWGLALAGTAALLLDGVDGWAARKTGLSSTFGARFDMEVDALFMLVLAALVWRAGQAGVWVLTTGLLRYIFLLAGQAWPVLAAPLPPLRRRKAICVAGIGLLLAALSPLAGPGVARLLSLAAVGLLCYSFAADTVRLVAGRRWPAAITT
jgi:phosphatidylglycerophosphate synthase